jgi:hypothetical protein
MAKIILIAISTVVLNGAVTFAQSYESPSSDLPVEETDQKSSPTGESGSLSKENKPFEDANQTQQIIPLNSEQSSAEQWGVNSKPSTNANSIKFDYNFWNQYGDQAWNSGSSKRKSSELNFQPYFGAYRDLGDNMSANLYLNLLPKNKIVNGYVDIATIHRKFGDNVSVLVGRDYLNVGGFENKTHKFDEDQLSAYSTYRLPFLDVNNGKSATVISSMFNHRLLGTISLQLTDDVTSSVATTAASDTAWKYINSQHLQPVGIFEWTRTFGILTPMIQVLSYDINHSLYTSAGLAFRMWPLSGYIDYVVDKKAYRDGDEKRMTRFSNMASRLECNFASVTVFLKYSQMIANQPEIDGIGNSTERSFDDNSLMYSAGILMKNSQLGNGFVPYLSLTRETQKVGDNARNPFSVVAEKKDVIMLGAKGSL